MDITALTSSSAPTVCYSGFWRRVIATLIDAAIIQLFTQVLFLIWSSTISLALFSASAAASLALFITSLFLMVLFSMTAGTMYCAIFESSRLLATPGKLFMQIYVTDLNGGQLSLARAIGRNVAKIISFLPLCLGYLCIAFTSRKQGLHDMIASTLVVKRPDASFSRILLGVFMIFVLLVVISVFSLATQSSN
jgi:uncharacterized RDD family membrane protein YckC